VRSYGYLFVEPQPQAPAYEGVPHAADVPYLYGSCAGLSATCPTLSKTMIDYMLSFATSLDPNDKKGAPRPQWLPYTNKSAVGGYWHYSSPSFADST
jgi:acetylcholinesterase